MSAQTKTAARPTIHTERINSVRFLTLTAILTAIAVVLQYLEFPVPMFIPPFVKFDFSDLPAILAAFLVSPVSGVAVCLLKNVIHLVVSQSAGVGELAHLQVKADESTGAHRYDMRLTCDSSGKHLHQLLHHIPVLSGSVSYADRRDNRNVP